MGAQKLADEGCLVGVACMPEFDTDGRAPLQRVAGYTFDEAAMCFGQGVEALRMESTTARAPLTLILHDWGVAPGIIWTNRCLAAADPVVSPAQLVCFDVLPAVDNKGGVPAGADSYRELAIHLNYRGLLATSFLLSRVVGKVASVFLGLGAAINFGFLGRWLNPVGALDGEEGKGGSIKDIFALPRLCYPYYHMFREALLGGALIDEFRMPPLTKIPMLYMYGREKNTMFHTQAALDYIDRSEGSEQVGIANAGHWVYHQQRDMCFEKVRSFVSKL